MGNGISIPAVRCGGDDGDAWRTAMTTMCTVMAAVSTVMKKARAFVSAKWTKSG
jgi:hypothetical protein